MNPSTNEYSGAKKKPNYHVKPTVDYGWGLRFLWAAVLILMGSSVGFWLSEQNKITALSTLPDTGLYYNSTKQIIKVYKGGDIIGEITCSEGPPLMVHTRK